MDYYEYCIGSTDAPFRKKLTPILNQAGFRSVGEAGSIPLLLRLLRTVQPRLVLVDTSLPPGNVKELADIIENDGLCAAIFFNTNSIEFDDYVLLDWPVDSNILKAVVRTVCVEFSHKKEMSNKIASLQNKLAEKNIINKAKIILMNRYNFKEEEAHRLLQKTSMNEQISMATTAKRVIRSPGSFAQLLPHQ